MGEGVDSRGKGYITHIYMCVIMTDLLCGTAETAQHCKAIILQFKKERENKKRQQPKRNAWLTSGSGAVRR